MKRLVYCFIFLAIACCAFAGSRGMRVSYTEGPPIVGDYVIDTNVYIWLYEWDKYSGVLTTADGYIHPRYWLDSGTNGCTLTSYYSSDFLVKCLRKNPSYKNQLGTFRNVVEVPSSGYCGAYQATNIEYNYDQTNMTVGAWVYSGASSSFGACAQKRNTVTYGKGWVLYFNNYSSGWSLYFYNENAEQYWYGANDHQLKLYNWYFVGATYEHLAGGTNRWKTWINGTNNYTRLDTNTLGRNTAGAYFITHGTYQAQGTTFCCFYIFETNDWNYLMSFTHPTNNMRWRP